MHEPETQRMEGGRGELSTVVDLQRVRLQVIESPGSPDLGRSCDSDAEMVLRVGTREDNHLVLSDKSVSGYHLEIERTSLGWRLRDEGSTNGTFLGGLRVIEVLLRSGCVLTLGRTKLRFDAVDESPVRAVLHPERRLGDVVGQSVVMRRLFARLQQVAASPATVLITGETGTGKEAVAEALVQNSPRARAPFVVIDCSSLPANLIESELFGHKKGAFTGANSDYRGAFERADGGTVFLDEIGELPLDLQPKLLRVLERREVRRVGSESVRPIDVRVLAATHRNLATEVNERRFRQDLYYRLSVVKLQLPPLRERIDDIPLLIEHFYSQITDGRHAQVPSLADVVARLTETSYPWPGNVRELRNAVERAVHLPDDDPLPEPEGSLPSGTPSSPLLGERPGERMTERPGERMTERPVDLGVPFKVAKQQLIDGFEREYISTLLRATRYNVSEAARRAKIDRMYLHKLITQHRLNEPE
jgi:transcriptional regulator with GAF, ATPase, and Fis domain